MRGVLADVAALGVILAKVTQRAEHVQRETADEIGYFNPILKTQVTNEGGIDAVKMLNPLRSRASADVKSGSHSSTAAPTWPRRTYFRSISAMRRIWSASIASWMRVVPRRHVWTGLLYPSLAAAPGMAIAPRVSSPSGIRDGLVSTS